MSLIVLIGAQAVGKMTVGRELERRIEAKLLYNHQTIDLFADFLGYNHYSFTLSEQMRKGLFQAFVKNKANNVTPTIIFTVLIDFDQQNDRSFLKEISEIFLKENEQVYFVELVSEFKERLKRNRHEDRLAAKPSKRNVEFSENELYLSMKNYRLESKENELDSLFPQVPSMKIDNTKKEPEEVAQLIIQQFGLM